MPLIFYVSESKRIALLKNINDNQINFLLNLSMKVFIYLPIYLFINRDLDHSVFISIVSL